MVRREMLAKDLQGGLCVISSSAEFACKEKMSCVDSASEVRPELYSWTYVAYAKSSWARATCRLSPEKNKIKEQFSIRCNGI